MPTVPVLQNVLKDVCISGSAPMASCMQLRALESLAYALGSEKLQAPITGDDDMTKALDVWCSCFEHLRSGSKSLNGECVGYACAITDSVYRYLRLVYMY